MKSTIVPPRALARAALLALACGLLLGPSSASAQSPPVSGSVKRSLASRAEVEQAALAADEAARRTSDSDIKRQKIAEAARLRDRLRVGDFQPGHRLYISVYGDSVLSDTFTVRGDRQLQLPDLPPISLNGVLDSELEAHLTKEIGRYLRNPSVEAQTLLSVTVSGKVGRPGFLNLPSDTPITDALMAAGGPANDAGLKKIHIKRGSDIVVTAPAVQEAITVGLTLSDLGVRPGDEIIVPANSADQLGRIFRVAGAVLAMALSIAWIID